MNHTKDKRLQELIQRYPELAGNKEAIKKTCDRISATFKRGNTLFLCGNGGSAADAEHIAGELLKGFTMRRPLSRQRRQAIEQAGNDATMAAYINQNLQQGFRVISLTGHVALSTAFGNDVAPDLIFAQQLNALGKAGDALLAISTSGNSRNIVLCATVARALGIKVIALTGDDGGILYEKSDILINVPATKTAWVQELHLPVYHTLCAMLENSFFNE